MPVRLLRFMEQRSRAEAAEVKSCRLDVAEHVAIARTDVVRLHAGTVCVMGSSGDAAEAAIERIRQAYHEAKGYLPQVFRDSSMGAERFGVVILRLVVP